MEQRPGPVRAPDHPLRRIRPLIDEHAIRRECAPLYSKVGRPSVPPEQLFLALLAGYLMGVRSERRLVMELRCDMAFRWFVGLQMTQKVWDHSTFSQNRRRRFDKSGVLERLFDQTVQKAIEAGLVSRHVSADGTLVRADVSYKSLAPIELTMDPEEYKRQLRSEDRGDPDEPQDPGNRAVNFRGEKRSNETHRSTSDPDSRLVSKGASGTSAYPGYTVNAVMENRHRIVLGIGRARMEFTCDRLERAIREVPMARKLSLLVALSASLLFVMPTRARAELPWQFDQHTRYMALGDSLAAGRGAIPATQGPGPLGRGRDSQQTCVSIEETAL